MWEEDIVVLQYKDCDGYINPYDTEWKCPNCGHIDDIEEIYEYDALTRAIEVLEKGLKKPLTKEEIGNAIDLIKWASEWI